MIRFGPKLLEASDYTLYGFSLAPIFAFSCVALFSHASSMAPSPSHH